MSPVYSRCGYAIFQIRCWRIRCTRDSLKLPVRILDLLWKASWQNFGQKLRMIVWDTFDYMNGSTTFLIQIMQRWSISSVTCIGALFILASTLYSYSVLSSINQNATMNSMSMQNLAIVFGPTLFGQVPTNGQANGGMADATLQNQVSSWRTIFDDSHSLIHQIGDWDNP